MKWIREAKLAFFDSCINILENPESPFGDATELSQFVDAGISISKEEFLALVELEDSHKELINEKNIEFACSEGDEMAWFYDGDIHYFYF